MRGFTLIELMIVIAIMGIVAIAARGVVVSNGTTLLSENWQRGGTICKAGVLFSIDTHGYQQQVIGVNGGGVACQ